VVGLATAAQDLLQVELTDSEQVILIPFVDEIVPIVDLITKRLEIVPPPGLLDL
jgi:16S rRNA processing protein RimM